MILYLKKVRNLLKKLMQVQIRHVLRAENSGADALAKLATASQENLGSSTLVEYMAEPSIDPYSIIVALVESAPSWMDPIWNYIIDGSLPDDPKEAAKIRARLARFTNHKGSLYKRGFFTQMHLGRGHQICTKRGTRGHMRESYRNSGVSRKSLEAGILLAYHAQGCNRPSQEMQDLSGARQDLTPPVRTYNIDHKSLAFPTMGFGHIGTPGHC